MNYHGLFRCLSRKTDQLLASSTSNEISVKGPGVAKFACVSILVPVCLSVITMSLFQDFAVLSEFDRMRYFSLMKRGSTDARIVLAIIDDRTIQSNPELLKDRRQLARGLQSIQIEGRAAIGFDAYISGNGNSDDDRMLAQAIRDSGIIIAKTFDGSGLFGKWYELVEQNEPSFGVAFISNDPSQADGPAIIYDAIHTDVSGQHHPSFPLAVVCEYIGKLSTPQSCIEWYLNRPATTCLHPLRYSTLDCGIRIRYVGSAKKYAHVKFEELVNNEIPLHLKDSIVLVGETLSNSGDVHRAPSAIERDDRRISGLAVIANTVNTLLSENDIALVASEYLLVLSSFVGFVGAIVVLHRTLYFTLASLIPTLMALVEISGRTLELFVPVGPIVFALIGSVIVAERFKNLRTNR